MSAISLKLLVNRKLQEGLYSNCIFKMLLSYTVLYFFRIQYFYAFTYVVIATILKYRLLTFSVIFVCCLSYFSVLISLILDQEQNILGSSEGPRVAVVLKTLLCNVQICSALSQQARIYYSEVNNNRNESLVKLSL